MRFKEEFLGLIPSIVVAVSVALILELPTRYIFALLMALIVFLIWQCLLSGEKTDRSWKFRIQISIRLNWWFVFLAIYSLSMISIVLISPLGMLYSNWSEIPAANWIRVFSAFVLINFFPGYVILCIMDQKHEISWAARVVFSFLLSYFFVTLISHVLASLKLGFSYFPWVFLAFNVSLAAMFSIYILKSSLRSVAKSSTPRIVEIHQAHFYLQSILVALAVLLFLSMFTVNFMYFPFIKGDLFSHFATTVQYLKEGWYEWWGQSNYPYWFYFNLASFLTISGFPLINSAMVSVFLSMLVIPAFFAMSQAFFKNKSTEATLSTVVFCLFSGLSWLYVVFLKLNGGYAMSNYGVWFSILEDARRFTLLRVHPFYYEWAYKPISVALISFISLLYLVFKENLSKSLRHLLLVLCLAVAFLVHIEEATLFILLYLPLVAIVYRKKLNAKTFIFSAMLGLALVLVLDVFSAKMVYFSLPFQLSFAAASLYAIGTVFMDKIEINVSYSQKIVRFIKIFILVIPWYLIGLSVIVFLYLFPFDAGPLYWEMGVFPWFFWPISFGIPLILSVIGFDLLILQKKLYTRNFLFIALVIISSLVFGRIIAYLNVNFYEIMFSSVIQWATGYREWRIVYLVYIFVSLIAGWSFSFILSRIKLIRTQNFNGLGRIVTVCLLCVIVFMGSMDTLLTVERRSLVILPGDIYDGQISSEELQAVDFIRHNTSAISGVLTTSWENALKTSLAGLRGWTRTRRIYDTKTELFFSSPNLSPVFHLLSARQVKYAYFTAYDSQELSLGSWKDGFFNKHLKPLLPIAFQNSRATVYEIPEFSPPSTTADVAMIVPFSLASTNVTLYSTFMLALSKVKYNILLEGDSSQFNYPIILLPSDLSPNTGENATGLEPHGMVELYQPSINENMAVLWRFDEGIGDRVNDSIGGIDGTVYGASWVDGKFGGALDFDGNDCIEVQDNKTFRLSEGTIAFWFKPKRGYTTGDGDQYLLYKNAAGQHSGDFSVGLDSQSGRLDFYLSNGTRRFDIFSKTTSWSEQWYYAAITFGPQGMKLYINGELQSENTEIGNGIEDNKWTLYIGNTEAPFGFGFEGSIDQLQISSRALGADEIHIKYLVGCDLLFRTSIRTYLDWVRNGGHLIVLNSYEHGSFANYLSIKNTDKTVQANGILVENETFQIPLMNMSSSDFNNHDVKVVVRYSCDGKPVAPLAYLKRVGEGTIMYVEVAPIFSTRSNSASLTEWKTLSIFPILLQGLNVSVQHQSYPFPEYEVFFYGYSNFTGSVQTIADSFLPFKTLDQKLEIDRLDLSNARSISIRDENLSKLSFDNVKLKQIVINGTSRSTVVSPSMEITNNDQELRNTLGVLHYQFLTFRNGIDWTLELPKNTSVKMTILAADSTYSIEAVGGRIQFHISTPVHGLATNLTIQVFGKAYFSHIFFGASYLEKSNVVKRFGEPLNIDGKLSLKIDLSGFDVAFLRGISYSGILNTPLPSWWSLAYLLDGDWNLPWFSIFESWLHVMLIVLFVGVISTLWIRKRKKSKLID